MIRCSLSQFVLLVVVFAGAAYCQQIPPDTILPIMATSTVDSTKAKPGDRLSGKLMQDVPLPSGQSIRTGAKVEGQVIESSNASATAGARLVVRFESLFANGKQYRIVASLRALASMQDVFFAQLPVGTFDEYGTSPSDWTTVQVGGAAVYRGDGTVRSAMDIVGPVNRLRRGDRALNAGSQAWMSGELCGGRTRAVFAGLLPVGLWHLWIRGLGDRPPRCQSPRRDD